jgi:hypothetical protein
MFPQLKRFDSMRHAGGAIAGVAMAVVLAIGTAACADPPGTDGSGGAAPATETTVSESTESESTASETTVSESTVSETTSPVTTPPAPLGTLVLSDDGIGPWTFGSDPDEVIAGVGAVLGSPTLDTGWTSGAEGLLCPGTQRRRIEWGVLRVEFGDVSAFADGRQHFLAWDYGLEGVLGEEPRGLITARGVGLGARVDELIDAYPDTQLSDGDEGVFSAGFIVNEFLTGLITGVEASDTVMVMFGGQPCGE